VGDVSSIAAGLPTLLLQARYSRDHEREADAYAANMLKENGIPPKRLADMLERLEKSHAPEGAPQTRDEGGSGDYLASHPATRERIKALEEQ
jgi:Zn-dependent protease with chaperone function